MGQTEVRIMFSMAAREHPRWKFWRKDSSLCIGRITRSPFSHVDLELDDGTLLGSSDNPKAPFIAGDPCGVAIRPANYQKFRIRRRAVIPCTQEQKRSFVAFCMDQLGKPFDHAAVDARYMLSVTWTSRDWRDASHWFCVEMLARATEVSGMLPWPIIAIKSRITAADYLLIINPIMSNAAEFWNPIVGLELRDGEV